MGATPMQSPHRTTSNTNPNPRSPSSSPSPLRQWKPAAQRNIRNQWSKLLAGKDKWLDAASEGRLHATALVNAYLNEKYFPDMELGVLKDMPGIRQKVTEKLRQNQEKYCSLLVSSYKDMVAASGQFVKAAHSMRCYLKRSTSSTIIQFCDLPEVENDHGDGGGLPVFSFYSLYYHEDLAREIVDMFLMELRLKRLLVVELLSLYYRDGMKEAHIKWSYELYLGEFNDLRTTGLLSDDRCEPLFPKFQDWPASNTSNQPSDSLKNSKILQVYLTTWLANVNVNVTRLNEIFAIVEDEILVKLS